MCPAPARFPGTWNLVPETRPGRAETSRAGRTLRARRRPLVHAVQKLILIEYNW